MNTYLLSHSWLAKKDMKDLVNLDKKTNDCTLSNEDSPKRLINTDAMTTR